MDINYLGNQPTGVADWMHANAVDYNEDLDQIMISAREFNEVWIIDHSTSTAEAASHSGGMYGKGGDLLYRWGNPEAYGRGDSTDRVSKQSTYCHFSGVERDACIPCREVWHITFAEKRFHLFKGR